MIVLTTQGPRSKFLSEEGGGGVIFFWLRYFYLIMFFLTYLFTAPPSARSLLQWDLDRFCNADNVCNDILLWYTTKTKPVVVIVSVALVPSGFPFHRSAKFNCRETYRWEHSFGSDGS